MAKIIADSDIPIDDDMKEEITQIYYDDFLDELEIESRSHRNFTASVPVIPKMKSMLTKSRKPRIKTIQAQSVLHAVAAAEKISITQEELAEELRAIAIEEDEDPEGIRWRSIGRGRMWRISAESAYDEDKTMAFILDSVIYDR